MIASSRPSTSPKRGAPSAKLERRVDFHRRIESSPGERTLDAQIGRAVVDDHGGTVETQAAAAGAAVQGQRPQCDAVADSHRSALAREERDAPAFEQHHDTPARRVWSEVKAGHAAETDCGVVEFDPNPKGREVSRAGYGFTRRFRRSSRTTAIADRLAPSPRGGPKVATTASIMFRRTSPASRTATESSSCKRVDHAGRRQIGEPTHRGMRRSRRDAA